MPIRILFFFCALFSLPASAKAQVKWISQGRMNHSLVLGNEKRGVAIGNPAKWSGLRVVPFSRCHAAYSRGLSVAPIKSRLTTMTGLHLGGYSHHKKMVGVQFSVINKGWKVYGFQVGILNFLNDDFPIRQYPPVKVGQLKGLQLGLFNTTHTVYGIQIGLVNWGYFSAPDAGKLLGIEIGLINAQGNNSGLQIGLLNLACAGNGISIGLLNFRPGNVWWARVMPGIGFGIKSKTWLAPWAKNYAGF